MSTRNLVLLIVILVSLCVGMATAAVPPMISYQGKLMQPSGAPVPDGSYSIQFAIYDDPASADPSHKLWGETNPNVQVKGGLFSALLGSVINLPPNIFDNPDRWFAVKVGADPEMTPRQMIASVGYAVKAGSADVATTVPDGSITTAKLAPGVATPVGTIVMWSGAVANVPQGWALCNGQNGTPDLTDKFIVGAGAAYSVGDHGGEVVSLQHSHTVSAHRHPTPDHRHGMPFHLDIAGTQIHLYYDQAQQYSGGISAPRMDFNVAVGGYSTVDRMTTDAAGSGYTDYQSPGTDQELVGKDNRPPYYALCFIMKVGS